MNALELLRLALSRLRTSRLRAALTMLGVVIGVASVVALVGVGQGTTANITSRLAGLGTNLLTISPTARSSTSGLTLEDAAAIAKVDGVAAVAPEIQTSASITVGTKATTTSVVGTSAQYALVRAYDVWQGSFLTDPTVASGLRVAVLGATTAADLGLDASSLGSTISVNGLPFRVIGILQPKGGAGFQNPDDQVLVPLAAVSKYFVGGDTVRTIGVSVASDDQMTAATNAITALLRERHELAATDTADFQVFNQTQLLDAASSISATLTLLLGGIASISLIVGGDTVRTIGVSVASDDQMTAATNAITALLRERHELAATDTADFQVFNQTQLLDAASSISATLTLLLGGLIGIVLGLAVSALIGQIAGWGFQFNPTTVAAAVLFSLAVGIVFGVWPARQAARLDPINALRYE